MAVLIYAYSSYIRHQREEQCNFEGAASERADLARVLEQILKTKVTRDQVKRRADTESEEEEEENQ